MGWPFYLLLCLGNETMTDYDDYRDDARDEARIMADDEPDSESLEFGYCPTCNGSGEGRHDGTTCYSCNGSGEC